MSGFSSKDLIEISNIKTYQRTTSYLRKTGFVAQSDDKHETRAKFDSI